MRTFEVPAMRGACMLVENTKEHMDIFGREGESVVYFRNIEEMTQKVKYLLENAHECERLAESAYSVITKAKKHIQRPP